MTNKPKNIGTKFESACVKEFKAESLAARRLALAGTDDCGDVEIVVDSLVFVIECKCYKKWGRGDVQKWRGQAVIESRNYKASFEAQSGVKCIPVLIVSQYGKSIKDSYAHIQYDGGGWIQLYFDEFIDFVKESKGAHPACQ